MQYAIDICNSKNVAIIPWKVESKNKKLFIFKKIGGQVVNKSLVKWQIE